MIAIFVKDCVALAVQAARHVHALIQVGVYLVFQAKYDTAFGLATVMNGYDAELAFAQLRLAADFYFSIS